MEVAIGEALRACDHDNSDGGLRPGAGQTAAMRDLAAWRLGCLDQSVDPVDGLEYGRITVLHGGDSPIRSTAMRPGPSTDPGQGVW